MTSLYLEDSEFGFGYGAIVNGIGYIPVVESSVECNCNQYEIDMFFESASNTDLNYEDDHWFAGYCLATEFLSSENEYWREIAIVNRSLAEHELMHDLFVHSVDTQVGF